MGSRHSNTDEVINTVREEEMNKISETEFCEAQTEEYEFKLLHGWLMTQVTPSEG